MTIQELGKGFKDIFGFNPPIDMLITQMRGPKKASIDIIKLDVMFAQRDPEYSHEECTYRGQKDIGMSQYVEQKWGKDAVTFISNNI